MNKLFISAINHESLLILAVLLKCLHSIDDQEYEQLQNIGYTAP